VLNAAIDARRLGIQAPLTDTLLRAAARGYLSTLHSGDAWLPPALTELTRHDRPRDHATAPLILVLNEHKTEILGYTVADYLLQHASRARRSARVPASTWDAALSYIRDPADAVSLAESAEDRLLYCYAVPLYRHAADAGGEYAARRLAGLLAERGDLDGLRARAGTGDTDAAAALADLLEKRGDLDGLRARADAGDTAAARRLANLLEKRGDLDGAEHILRAGAGAGDTAAARRLADLLEKRGDLDGAEHILRAGAGAGDRLAAWQLEDLLIKRGRDEEAERLRRFGLNLDGSTARA